MGVKRTFNEEKTDVERIEFSCDSCNKQLDIKEEFTAVRLRAEPIEGKPTVIFLCNPCEKTSSISKFFNED